MKNSLIIAILLTFVLAVEAIGSAILYQQHEICLLDLCADGEVEKDSKEKEFKHKLPLRPIQYLNLIPSFQNQNAYIPFNISQQVAGEVVTPPPEFQ